MISGEEFGRRLRRLSQLRSFTLGLKRSALRSYNEGNSRYKPKIDIRSDYEYWKKLAEEKGFKIDSVDGDVR